MKENATTDNGTITVEKVEPTCTEDGTYTYKAVVKFRVNHIQKQKLRQ